MPQTDHDRSVALAAVFQAGKLVQALAREGQAPAEPFNTCLHSIVQVDAPNSLAIYGRLADLRLGLQTVAEQLRQPRDGELTGYCINLLILERKLNQRPELMQQLQRGIQTAQERLLHFPLNHSNQIAALAELYSQTISTLKPRIMVNGDPRYLTISDNANRIRALLLAGIRAAVLWRQSGGGRFTLLWRRNAILLEVQRMLAQLERQEQHL